MTKTVYALHTGPVLVEVLKDLMPEFLPGVRLVNIVDDGLLTDVRTAGEVTPMLRRRLVGYGMVAAASGANAILNCCSSVGEAADALASLVDVPVVKIDERMAETAIAAGKRIAVVATVATTLDPTERLIQRKAAARHEEVSTRRYLADAAFDALLAGEPQLHDDLVREVVLAAMAENDVVVLAQGSMARLVPLVQAKGTVPVLSSPRLGMQALRETMGLA